MTSGTPAAAGPQEFAGRVVIVSGAAGKLGRVICEALIASGASVVLNDINEDALQEMVNSHKDQGGSVTSVALSATQGYGIVKRALQAFGHVHAVINATLGAVDWRPFADTTNASFQASFENNVLGPISLVRAAWPHFQAQKFGRVVNFTSDGMLGFPTASTYTFSKGALLGINKTLAMEGASHNIKCNCVSPIAFAPHMQRHIQHFSSQVQEAFQTRYKPEGNVPMILALISEGCQVSGEIFTTSGWAVGRCLLGYTAGDNEMRTVDECLAKINGLCEKGTKDVFEPASQVDFTEWQAKYVMGK